MARPIKQGIGYFPLDVSLDLKMELIEAEFGITGFGVVVKLYQMIYGERGYYLEWTNEVALLFAKKINVGRSAVSEILEAAIKRGIFDKSIYDKYGVLTSKGIQERYLEAVERRKNVKLIKEYLLVSDIQNYKNVCIYSINVDINEGNEINNAQKKEKKIILKKTDHDPFDDDDDFPPPRRIILRR